MKFLIDGYNLLFKIYPGAKDLKKLRGDLIDFLENRFEALNLKGKIIFDYDSVYSKDAPTKSRRNRLDVILVPESLTADDYILEILSHKSNPSQLTLVSSDRNLCQKAKDLGVKIQSSEDFIHYLTKTPLRKIEKKPTKESPERIASFLKIFQKRLDEE